MTVQCKNCYFIKVENGEYKCFGFWKSKDNKDNKNIKKQRMCVKYTRKETIK